MKVIELDCSRCKCKTTHVKRSNQSDGETIIFGFLTAGIAFATREYWYQCTRCKKTINI